MFSLLTVQMPSLHILHSLTQTPLVQVEEQDLELPSEATNPAAACGLSSFIAFCFSSELSAATLFSVFLGALFLFWIWVQFPLVQVSHSVVQLPLMQLVLHDFVPAGVGFSGKRLAGVAAVADDAGAAGAAGRAGAAGAAGTAGAVVASDAAVAALWPLLDDSWVLVSVLHAPFSHTWHVSVHLPLLQVI
jgi:hypothetical protein